MVDAASFRFPNVDPKSSATNCDEDLGFDHSIDWPYVRGRVDGADVASIRERSGICLATTQGGKRLAEDILPEANGGSGGLHNARWLENMYEVTTERMNRCF